MSETYTEALQKQCDLMLKIAKRLDEKGYAVLFHKLNPVAAHEQHTYAYFLGAVTRFAGDWSEFRSRGRSRRTVVHPVFLHVWPQEWCGTVRQDIELVRRTGKVFDHPFNFRCQIPVRVRYRSIHASLAVMTNNVKRGERATTSDRLNVRPLSDTLEYVGDTKDQLEILLRILDMPQHRKILLGE